MDFKKVMSQMLLVFALFSITCTEAVHFAEDAEGNPVAPSRRDEPSRPDRNQIPDWKPASAAIPLGDAVNPKENKNDAPDQAVNSSYINPKTLLTSGVIAASLFGGTYLLNKKTNIGSQVKAKAQTLRSKLKDWLNQPLTKLDTYIAAGLMGTAYYAYSANWPARAYNSSIAFKDSVAENAKNSYEKAKSFLSQMHIPRPIVGASCLMAMTGLLCAAYKRYTSSTHYIQAYRKFDNSLRTNLLQLSSQYPKFIELYGKAESNPHCLLEGEQFENAPIMKYLTPIQIRLLKEAITVFDQEKK